MTQTQSCVCTQSSEGAEFTAALGPGVIIDGQLKNQEYPCHVAGRQDWMSSSRGGSYPGTAFCHSHAPLGFTRVESLSAEYIILRDTFGRRHSKKITTDQVHGSDSRDADHHILSIQETRTQVGHSTPWQKCARERKGCSL